MIHLNNSHIGLFIPCCIDQFSTHTGWNTVKLFDRLGLEVHYPTQITCCGKELYYAGDREGARQLAGQLIESYRGYDYVVSCGSGCVAYLKQHLTPLMSDTTYQHEAANFLPKLYDICDFLVNVLHFLPSDVVFPHKVALLDHCTTLRDYGLRQEPRQLLHAIQGLELVEMEQADLCCGFGGLFSNHFAPISTELARIKVQRALEAGAQYITSTEMSCLLHLQSYIDKNNINLQCRHIVDILMS